MLIIVSKSLGGGLGFLLGRSIFREWVVQKLKPYESLQQTFAMIGEDGMFILELNTQKILIKYQTLSNNTNQQTLIILFVNSFRMENSARFANKSITKLDKYIRTLTDSYSFH